MLADRTSSAIVAVADIERARRFYGDVLGLRAVEEGGEVLVFATGATHLVVYRSDFAGTNRANAVVFDAGEAIEAIVADLARKGVAFERYEMPDTEFRDGIHHADGMKLSWFKDPDGNLVHLNAMPDAAAAGERAR